VPRVPAPVGGKSGLFQHVERVLEVGAFEPQRQRVGDAAGEGRGLRFAIAFGQGVDDAQQTLVRAGESQIDPVQRSLLHAVVEQRRRHGVGVGITVNPSSDTTDVVDEEQTGRRAIGTVGPSGQRIGPLDRVLTG